MRGVFLFQNLIGMLGSMCHLGITQPHVYVSKPYRYARKCLVAC